MKRTISVLFIIYFTLFSTFSSTYAAGATGPETTEPTEIVYEGAPDLYSEAAIVMDANSGQILYQKNAYAAMYPASITKILTTLIALEHGDLESTVTMSEEAVYGIEWGSSHIGLQPGEQITLKDALYATMLPSANDAAWGVAEHIAGDMESFAQLMNEKASSLGCINSNFVNSHGLHDDSHYTCAYDMALITREAIKNPTFVEITSTKETSIAPTSHTLETRYLIQGNNLILSNSEHYYPFCYGGKTGYTNKAQGTLVSWAERDGVTLICVTMKSSLTPYKYEDTIALFDYCFSYYSKAQPLLSHNFSAEDIAATEKHLDAFYGGKNLGTLSLSIDKSTYMLLSDYDEIGEVTFEYTMTTDRLSESIVGDVAVYSEGKPLLSVPVTFEGYINSEDEDAVKAAVAAGIIENPNKFKFNFFKVFGTLILIAVVGLGVAYAYARISYIKKKRRAYIKRRNAARKNGKSF
ncbi:MAG: D-alanyl-D-alanine carboxypeptidase [Lachnospiraceae bacterium]|nr:D-alanyl-D-alanine carboxypeptidase [Lachnospiraceae bacterium]